MTQQSIAEHHARRISPASLQTAGAQPPVKGEGARATRAAEAAEIGCANNLMRPLADVAREHVLRVLRAVHGDKARACQVLQIGRRTLDIKLHSWDLAEEFRRKPGPAARHV